MGRNCIIIENSIKEKVQEIIFNSQSFYELYLRRKDLCYLLMLTEYIKAKPEDAELVLDNIAKMANPAEEILNNEKEYEESSTDINTYSNYYRRLKSLNDWVFKKGVLSGS